MTIDGKTLCGSADRGAPPAHMVSAFDIEHVLVLGQVEKGGDCRSAVKGNEPTLLAKIETACLDYSESSLSHEDIEKSYGRILVQVSHTESRTVVVDSTHWSKCKKIGRVDSFSVLGGKPSELEQRHYISSREFAAEKLASAARAHWAIENRLHWMLDVKFREDGSQVRRGNATQNLSLLKTIALNLICSDTSDKARTSLRKKHKRATWGDNISMHMLDLKLL